VYGTTSRGLEYWYVNSREVDHAGTAPSVIAGLKVWGVHEMAVFGYYSSELTFDGLVTRGNFAQLNNAPLGVYLADYMNYNFTITNSDIQGMSAGFVPSSYSGGGLQTIQNSYLRDVTGVSVNDLWTSNGSSNGLPARTVIVRNVRFAAPTGLPLQAIVMSIPDSTTLQTRSTNLIQTNQVFVYDYNGVSGKNFQVYFKEQAPDYVLPQSTYDPGTTQTRLTASPEAGLTNQQAWAKYQIALAGAIAPTTDTLDGIVGYVRYF